MVTVADIYVGESPVLTNVPVTGGSISADTNADVRRNGSIQVINPSRVFIDGITSGPPRTPSTPTGQLTTVDLLRAEVAVRLGFIFSNGVQETVPLGRFLVWSASIDYDGGDGMSLELYDRAKYLQQTSILHALDFSGQYAQAAIQTLVNQSLPFAKTVVFSADVPDLKLPGGTIYDTDCLDAVLQVCDFLGAEFFFDLTGNPMVQMKKFITTATPLSAAQFAFYTGEDGGNITQLGRTVSRQDVYNGVGVYGTQPDGVTAQPFGEAYDLNPSSRTFWQGPFGKAFKRIDRPELTSSDDCTAAALAELNKSISLVQPAEFEAMPMPALEPGDIISVGFPDLIDPELHVVDTIEMDLDAASIRVTTRSQNRTD